MILGGFGWFYLNLSDSLDSCSRFMRLGQIPCLRLYFLIKTKDPTPSQLAPSSLSPTRGNATQIRPLVSTTETVNSCHGFFVLESKQTPLLLSSNHFISSQTARTEVRYNLYLGCASRRSRRGQASSLRILVNLEERAAHRGRGVHAFPPMTKPPVFT